MKHEWPIVVESPVVQALREGRAKIESGWCQGALWLDIPGCLGGPKYCAIGALADGNLAGTLYLDLALPDGVGLAQYNDLPTTTQADILALYDRAIEIALAQ